MVHIFLPPSKSYKATYITCNVASSIQQMAKSMSTCFSQKKKSKFTPYLYMVSSCLSFSFPFLGGEGRDTMSTCCSQKNQCLICTYTWYLVFPFFFFFFFLEAPRGGGGGLLLCEEREREREKQDMRSISS